MSKNQIWENINNIYERMNISPVTKQVIEVVTAGMITNLMSVAAELKIAESLVEGAKTAEEIAKETESNVDSIYRVMRTLASFGIFNHTTEDKFELNLLSECLKVDSQHSLRGLILFSGKVRYKACCELLHSVKTGQPAFDKAFGVGPFEWFSQAENFDSSIYFNQSLISVWGFIYKDIPTAYDFSKFNKIIDVGGNHGMLLESILKTYSNVKGVLFDLPHVTQLTQARFEQIGLSDRCETISGNFFEQIPSGGDAYLLAQVIHDWTDEKSVEIMKNIKAAMSKESKLLILESLLYEKNEPSFGKFMDIEMLVMTGGRERTQQQYANLLSLAGFEHTNTIKTKNLIIVEGTPKD